MSETGGQPSEPGGPTDSFEDYDFGDLSESRVEVAIEEGSKEGSDYVITMRDGSKPDGPVLRFTPAEWDAFVAGVRDGEFDLDETGALVDLPDRDEDSGEFGEFDEDETGALVDQPEGGEDSGEFDPDETSALVDRPDGTEDSSEFDEDETGDLPDRVGDPE